MGQGGEVKGKRRHDGASAEAGNNDAKRSQEQKDGGAIRGDTVLRLTVIVLLRKLIKVRVYS